VRTANKSNIAKKDAISIRSLSLALKNISTTSYLHQLYWLVRLSHTRIITLSNKCPRLLNLSTYVGSLLSFLLKCTSILSLWSLSTNLSLWFKFFSFLCIISSSSGINSQSSGKRVDYGRKCMGLMWLIIWVDASVTIMDFKAFGECGIEASING
jgi:hypothetical protein